MPTRVAELSILSSLGLLEDVATVFETLGMGRLWRLEHYVYPRYVKEFIPTCRITYSNPKKPIASEGNLTFFINKRQYTKSLFQVCDMYGFTKGESIAFPKLSSADANAFWGKIAGGSYKSRTAKITHIRNLVMRYVAKLISHFVYFRAVAPSVTETEFPMLFYIVKHLLEEFASLRGPDANVAVILCDAFVKMKTTAPTSASQSLSVGAVFT